MRQHIRHILACGITAVMAVVSTGAVAQAEKFPSKPMNLIVPWGPGGGADIMGRLAARWIESDLKTTVVVNNLPGATGSIGLRKMVSEPADGHTIGVLTGDTLTMAALPGSPFKLGETRTLGIMIRQASGLFAKFDGPYKSWDDVVAAAKAKPGTISVAITGANSPDELTIKYLETKGIRMITVPYTKPGERYVSVLGGHVDLLYEQAGDVRSHIDSKAMRPVLFFAPKRLAEPFADVPVSADYGYDVLLPQTRSILAHAKTDPRRLEALSASLARWAATPEFAKYLKDQYAEPDSFVPMANAQNFLEAEIQSFQKINGIVNK
jgi:tripartite-type tricarboxylate transporter receptor subunit TctC